MKQKNKFNDTLAIKIIPVVLIIFLVSYFIISTKMYEPIAYVGAIYVYGIITLLDFDTWQTSLNGAIVEDNPQLRDKCESNKYCGVKYSEEYICNEDNNQLKAWSKFNGCNNNTPGHLVYNNESNRTHYFIHANVCSCNFPSIGH